jgi:hypothetical protein
MPPRVVPVPSVKETALRAVAYLVWPEDEDVTAAATVEKLAKSDGTEKAKVWARFDYWVDGGQPHDKYFHGWNEPGFEHCFVFKWNKGGKDKGMQRLYGTLFHPRQMTKGFRVCVLFSHCVKYGKRTDPEQKLKAEALYVNADVIAAVKKQYSDK